MTECAVFITWAQFLHAARNSATRYSVHFHWRAIYLRYATAWKHWPRYIDDGDPQISNNKVEKWSRPIALGRANWLFAGSLRAGKRAETVRSRLRLGGASADALRLSSMTALGAALARRRKFSNRRRRADQSQGVDARATALDHAPGPGRVEAESLPDQDHHCSDTDHGQCLCWP